MFVIIRNHLHVIFIDSVAYDLYKKVIQCAMRNNSHDSILYFINRRL